MRRLLPPTASDVDVDDAYQLPIDTVTHVRANMVTSVDGAAMVDGRVGPLTGPADQRVLHTLRARADVILVGAGTIRAEGYSGPLVPETCQGRRRARGLSALPRLAIVSGRLDLDLTTSPFADVPDRPVVITASSAPQDRRQRTATVAEVVVAGEDHVDIPTALGRLAALGLGRVLCEGGPRLLAQLVAASVVDELCLSVAPAVVAGGGRRVTDGPALAVPSYLRLSQVLEDDEFLFLTYRAQPA